MSDDESDADDVERLLEDIRGDWRRLGDAVTDLEKHQVRKEMQARFEALRRRLEHEGGS